MNILEVGEFHCGHLFTSSAVKKKMQMHNHFHAEIKVKSKAKFKPANRLPSTASAQAIWDRQ